MEVGTYIKKNRMTTVGSNRGKDFISPYFKEVNRSYLYIVERVSHIEFDTYKQEYYWGHRVRKNGTRFGQEKMICTSGELAKPYIFESYEIIEKPKG